MFVEDLHPSRVNSCVNSMLNGLLVDKHTEVGIQRSSSVDYWWIVAILYSLVSEFQCAFWTTANYTEAPQHVISVRNVYTQHAGATWTTRTNMLHSRDGWISKSIIMHALKFFQSSCSTCTCIIFFENNMALFCWILLSTCACSRWYVDVGEFIHFASGLWMIGGFGWRGYSEKT